TQRGMPLAAIEQAIRDRLRSEIELLGNAYDVVLIDCAPGVSPFTTAAIGLADLLIVPTVPDRPSVLGLEAFIRSVVTEMPPPSGRLRLPPQVLITRYAPKRFIGWFGRRAKIEHHDEELKRIGELAKHSVRRPPRFELMDTCIRETVLMPH